MAVFLALFPVASGLWNFVQNHISRCSARFSALILDHMPTLQLQVADSAMQKGEGSIIVFERGKSQNFS